MQSIRPVEGKESTNGTIFKETLEYNAKKVKVELSVTRAKCYGSQQGGGAALTAAFLTLGAHE